MKNKNIFIQLSLLVIGLFLVFALGCIKEEVPTVSTTEITNVTMSSAISGGFIEDDGGVGIIDCGVCWSTNDNPTIADNKTIDTLGAFGFESSIKGLEPNKTYYVRAYATNSVGTGYGNVISFKTSGFSTFTDPRDGNVYKTIQIGNQIWMAENLKYLPSVVGYETGSVTYPYYYVYGYNGTNISDAKATENYATYGVLYNWSAVMGGAMNSNNNPSGVRGVCPEGWHVPSEAEWTELTDFLGGEVVAGGKLKETGTEHWKTPNKGATNETGFTALAGGMRSNYGDYFFDLGKHGCWWTTTKGTDADDAKCVFMFYDYGNINVQASSKTLGGAVRCVKN